MVAPRSEVELVEDVIPYRVGEEVDGGIHIPLGASEELTTIAIVKNVRQQLESVLRKVSLEPGDAIVFFHGAATPFLLRKVCLDKGKGNAPSCTADDGSRSAERWQLVGDCYLHGFMNNEILRPDYKGKHRLFWLV